MCHSLVMNYGLYKKMEIFVRFATSILPNARILKNDLRPELYKQLFHAAGQHDITYWPTCSVPNPRQSAR